jgi:hypothetical protein
VFDPPNQYFGTDTGGPRFDQPDYYQGEKRFEPWRWAYLGHQTSDRVLFLAQQQPDTLSDTFSYLGNSTEGLRSRDGMVVFGFGRAEGATPLMRGQNRFAIGFWEEKVQDKRAHRRLRRALRRLW